MQVFSLQVNELLLIYVDVHGRKCGLEGMYLFYVVPGAAVWCLLSGAQCKTIQRTVRSAHCSGARVRRHTSCSAMTNRYVGVFSCMRKRVLRAIIECERRIYCFQGCRIVFWE